MRPFVVASFFVVFAAGCCGAGVGPTNETAPAPVPHTQASLTVELGTGESSFTALADDATVSIVHGPQGGTHVWTSVRVTPAIASFTVNVSVTDADSHPVGSPSGWAAQRHEMDPYVEADGLKAYVDEGQVVGREVVLHVDVVSPDGRHGGATKRLRVVDGS